MQQLAYGDNGGAAAMNHTEQASDPDDIIGTVIPPFPLATRGDKPCFFIIAQGAWVQRQHLGRCGNPVNRRVRLTWHEQSFSFSLKCDEL
jgi:hypothetical protein